MPLQWKRFMPATTDNVYDASEAAIDSFQVS